MQVEGGREGMGGGRGVRGGGGGGGKEGGAEGYFAKLQLSLSLSFPWFADFQPWPGESISLGPGFYPETFLKLNIFNFIKYIVRSVERVTKVFIN